MTTIKITYASVDGVRETRPFKTLAGAQKFAHKAVGAHPEMGQGYAVSGDGIGKITCRGDCTLEDLFPETAEADANAADQGLLDRALDGSLMASIETDPLAIDPLDLEATEEPSAEEPEAVSPSGAEEPTDDHGDETERRGGIGQMIRDLLVDPEAYGYQEIVDIVRGEFPQSKTSRRSIASVAAALKRSGVEFPSRRPRKAD